MSLNILRSTIREIVDQLAKEDYEAVVRRCAKTCLTCDNLRTVIHEYGRNIVPPPPDAYNKLDAVRVSGIAMPTWSIRAPLWTKEEGRSDLMLELTISVGPGIPRIELDDLHVL